MDTLHILQNTWFVLVAVLLLGYSILDGFDLGIGSLMPFLAKNDNERLALIKTVGPFWDGNEVWLLTGGGALFASFPDAYATVFSGFYLAMMLVLFALIFRAVSIEFYMYDEGSRKVWQWCFIIGSFLPSLLFGVALGNVMVGVPLANLEFMGNFFTLLRPFPLLIGLLGLNAILLQGSTFTALKVTGPVRERARAITGKLWVSFFALFLLTLAMTFVYLPDAPGKILPWMFTLVVVAGWVLLKRALKNGRDSLSFYMSSLSFVGLWGIIGAVQFPLLVRASNNIDLSLTVRNASASTLSLKVMLIIALIGMPLVLFYTYTLFKTFKGNVKVEE
ncbi:MAG: cytochrome d ubiquinol oxidase subunit II [bacterium]|nr:cytochrome d ubiquinol oxidase subunit II [bacterium]